MLTLFGTSLPSLPSLGRRLFTLRDLSGIQQLEKRENDSPENQSINQPINQTKDQPINQPTKQPTDQPTNQSSNLNFDTSILDSSLFSFHLLMDSGWLRLNTLHVQVIQGI